MDVERTLAWGETRFGGMAHMRNDGMWIGENSGCIKGG